MKIEAKLYALFVKGLYTDPSTGKTVKRAGRDWAHDTGSRGPCSEVKVGQWRIYKM